MTQFFRWQFWRKRSRYWRAKCRAVESRYEKLMLQAEAEVWRNRSREDMFASARVLGARGMIGIAPRTGPAAIPQSVRQVSADPWANVTGVERMEFQEFYLKPGLESGYSRQSIEAKFFADRASRKSLVDEPSM